MTRKVVLVTGASRGIGRATAQRLARDGFDVVVNYHENEKGAAESARAVEAAGGRAFVVRADVARPDEAAALVARALEAFGRLDAVVNNAGVYERATTPEATLDQFTRAIDANLAGTYHVTRAALGHLERGARIVNFSSILGATGSKHGAHYAAAKGGVVALTKSWAKELAPRGILVNAVAPGAIDTDMIGGDSPDERRARESAIPLGRVGRPEEIAGCVAFLLGPDSSYVTGAVLHANGGLYV